MRMSIVVTAVKLQKLTCQRCGWIWTPRKKKSKPVSCPRCRSYLWNSPKEVEL